MDYVFQMKNVSKTFGEVQALHDINFEVGTNEIVGLLGDNGAGKSTLIKIITGYHHPDPGGELYLEGRAARTPDRRSERGRSASTRSTRSARWPTSSPSGATSSWVAS